MASNGVDGAKGKLGKLLYYDPNPIKNQSIQTEDLNIIVELSTERKSRSVLTVDENAGTFDYDQNSGGTIRFMSGTSQNGSQYLTTNYTELSTDLGDGLMKTTGSDLEGLNISDINIEFNSAYTPMITINFVDVRGGALMSRGNESNYRVFFDLPYPTFKLKVKGFYGKAVQYCLHLTKWNGKFNSKTGNFEIQAEFIGYTYAMFNDVLLGYMRAITKTDIGLEIFNEHVKDAESSEDSKGKLVTINQLLTNIQTLNERIAKLKTDDEDLISLQRIRSDKEINRKVGDFINTLKHDLQDEDNKLSKGTLINDDDLVLILNTNKSLISTAKKLIKKYEENIDGLVKGDGANYAKLVENKDKLIDINFIDDLTIKNYETEFAGDDKKIERVEDKNLFEPEMAYWAVDLTEIIKTYKPLEDSIIANEKSQTTIVSDKLDTLSTEVIGFKPTLKNMMRIITTHIEVFLEALRRVGINTNGNDERTKELSKLKSGLRVKEADKTKLPLEFFPFPEYSTTDEDDKVVETWIGSNPKVDTSLINETAFVEELLKGLLAVKKEDIDRAFDADINPETEGDDWYPINPIEISNSLGVKENPYNSIVDAINPDEVYAFSFLRAFSLMGVSHYSLSNEEIKVFAHLDAESIMNALENPKTKKGLLDIDGTSIDEKVTTLIDKFLTGKNDGLNKSKKNGDEPLFSLKSITGTTDIDVYIYDYVFGRWDKTRTNMSKYTGDGAAFPITSRLHPKRPHVSNSIDGIGKFSSPTGTSVFNNTINGKQKFNTETDGSEYIRILDRLPLTTPLSPKYGSEIIKNFKPSNSGNISLSALKLQSNDVSRVPTQNKGYGLNPFDTDTKLEQFNSIEINGDTEQLISDIYSNNMYFGLILCDNYEEKQLDGYNDKAVTNLNEEIGFDSKGGGGSSKSEGDLFTIAETDFWQDNGPLYRSKNFTSYGKTRNLLSKPAEEVYVSQISFLGNANNNQFNSFLNSHFYWNKHDNVLDLFGSEFYYSQDSNHNKALLFLHTLPHTDFGSLFSDSRPLINILGNSVGFTTLPKITVLFIGALLWRWQYKGHSNAPSDINFSNAAFLTTDQPPSRDELIYPDIDGEGTFTMYLGGHNDNKDWKKIPLILQKLPKQAKIEFITRFEQWVVDENGFEYIQNELELYDGDTAGWNDKFLTLSAKTVTNKAQLTDPEKSLWSGKLNKTDLEGTFTKKNLNNDSTEVNITKNYIYASPLFQYGTVGLASGDIITGVVGPSKITGSGGEINGNFHLIMRPSTDINKYLVKLLKESLILQSNTFRIWRGNGQIGVDGDKSEIYVDENQMVEYVKQLITKIEELSKKGEDDAAKLKDSLKKQIFNTLNDDIIKLSIYRTLSSIYRKWVAGSSEGGLFGACGYHPNAKDVAANSKKPRLIDTFRFMDRAYSDIGDKMIVNPIGFNKLFTTNLNSNSYYLITDILSANNFDFISLPSYINFSDIDGFADAMKPYSYMDTIGGSNTSVGPSFVCMYVGQTSTDLDLGDDSSGIINDGIILQPTPPDEDGNVELVVLSKNDNVKDFTDEKDDNKYEYVPVLGINYAQQNQSYFKDLTLDQKEFTETQESLIIMDEISNWGNSNKRTPVGQNLYNVYQTRSYSCEVESMGNALIQPMMYFHLNNMPIFRGLYTILNVNHKISPHQMTTKFKGVRIKDVRTPLLKSETIFMNLLGSIDDISVIDSSSGGSGGLEITPYDAELGVFIDTPLDINLLPISNDSKTDKISINNNGVQLQEPLTKTKYGLREVVEALQTAFKTFHDNNKGSTEFNNVVYTNDMSKEGGGVLKKTNGSLKHTTHQKGQNIDLRQITSKTGTTAQDVKFAGDFFAKKSNAKDTDNALVKYKGYDGNDIYLIDVSNDTRDKIGNYSREGTRQFIQALLDGEKTDITIKSNKKMATPNLKPIKNSVNESILINHIDVLTNKDIRLIPKFDTLDVRSKPEIDGGLVDNIIKTYDKTGDSDSYEFIVELQKADTDGGELLWFKVKLPSEVLELGLVTHTKHTIGWVRQDEVTFEDTEIISKTPGTKTNVKVKLPKIQRIIFNDPVLIAEFKEVVALSGHHNHMHLKYEIPERVKVDIDAGGENSRRFTS